MSYPINVVSHDSWHERDRPLIEDPPELTPVLQERLKCLSESLSQTLHPALILERRFGEQNNKAMFLAPFIRSVIHASATDIDIQHISLFPLAVDPCITPDPLFRTFLKTVRPPCYGFVTGIICGSIPFPIDRSETNENENNALSVQDFVDEEESDSEESSVDFVEWINSSSRSRRKKDASTAFYHNNIPPVSDRSTVLDHSFLARLTVDIAEETTPLSLFCIGQKAALQSALISCLFQRSAWGIRDPLVGLVLDRTTTVRILVAWLEDSAELDCFVVHIAQDKGGYYDLSDASEALKFASFVANVGRQFSTICRTAMAFTDQLKQDISVGRLKHWRLDQAELVPCFVLEKEPTPNAKIEGWRTGVSEYIKDDNFTLSTSSPTNMSSRTAKSKSNTNSPAPSINVQEERDDTSSEKPTLSSKVSTDSLAPHVGSSAGKASIAASRLAAGNGDADKGRRTRFWTFSRLSVSRTLYPYMVLKNEIDAGKGETGTSEDIYLNFCSQYYSILPFSWFDTDADAPLATSQEVQELLIAGQSGVDDYKSLERIGQYPPYKPLSQECDKVLRRNLDEVASVYSAIRNLLNSPGKANLKEVECRQSLDRLMMKFFHGNISGSADILQDYSKPHVMVSLERSLMLPRAFVAERYQSLSKVPRVTLMADVAAELNSSLSRDRAKVARVVDKIYPSSHNVADLATRAGSSTLDEDTQRARFEQDIRPLVDIVIDASKPERYTALDPEDMSDYHKEEPTWAICDSVGFIRIQNVFTAKTASTAFNLIHPPTTYQLKERDSKYKSTDAEGAGGAGAKTVTGVIVEGSLGRHLHPYSLDDILSHSQNMAASRAVPKGSDKPDISEQESPKEKVRHSFMGTMKVVDTQDSESTVKPGDNVVDVQKDLFLPIIVSEYKKHSSQFIPTSVNQGRIYATAAIKFYAAMGIYGLGVYTVISEGCLVYVTLSYGEEKLGGLGPDQSEYTLPPHPPPKDGKKDMTELIPSLVHIIERHPISFDVSEYSGLINFVTFLIKLRIEYVPMVVKTVRAACLKRTGKAPPEGEPQDLQKEMKAHLKSMGIPLGGTYKATWRRHKATK